MTTPNTPRKFTPRQRAELRDAIARSRLAAETELRKLRRRTTQAARQRAAAQAQNQRPQLTQFLPARDRHQPQWCIYCGNYPIPGAAVCRAHTSLLKAHSV